MVETDIIASIAVSLSARAVMLVIMCVETIKTDVKYCFYRKCYNVHAVRTHRYYSTSESVPDIENIFR